MIITRSFRGEHLFRFLHGLPQFLAIAEEMAGKLFCRPTSATATARTIPPIATTGRSPMCNTRNGRASSRHNRFGYAEHHLRQQIENVNTNTTTQNHSANQPERSATCLAQHREEPADHHEVHQRIAHHDRPQEVFRVLQKLMQHLPPAFARICCQWMRSRLNANTPASMPTTRTTRPDGSTIRLR